MAGAPLPCRSLASDTRRNLVRSVEVIATELLWFAVRSIECSETISVADELDLSLKDRVLRGDRLAIYDVIVEACQRLDEVREALGELLADSAETLDRLSQMRMQQKDALGRAAQRTERQRSRVCRSGPASQG